MENILGIDLGTNSIGLSLRNANVSGNIQDQLEYFTSIIFPSGVGKGKSGEFSYAAERTKHRSSRRLYQARRYKIWETLKLLIEKDYCPLSKEDLERWSKYDKTKGFKRQYPIHATHFEQWIRLDFDGDGKPDYANPYELRAQLVEEQFDFTIQINRYKLGRALYHIAQHRGFKSSKGETLKEQEQNEKEDIQDFDLSEALKKSEEKKSGKLAEYMKNNNLPTVGCAFAHLRKKGVRIRNSEYQTVRSQYKDEIRLIFNFQVGLDKNGDFYKRLMSEKKGEGTIFYKRPLRSQKGQVGLCTFEPNKPRCPISHPEFEKFRAWCLINNIRFGEDLKETLTLEQKKDLFNEKFLLTRSSFKFEEIREWIQKRTFKVLDYKTKTINYKDKSSVSGCPISGRLKNLFGDDWEKWEYVSTIDKVNKKTGEIKKITYSVYDLWHVCFSFEEPEYIETFAKEKLHFDEKQTKQLVRIFFAIQQGYSMLSFKAIKNINRFLEEGLIYPDAILLAKLPDVFKERWTTEKESIVSGIDSIIEKNRKQKQLFNIANTLIANYKSLSYDDENGFNERFADHNVDYKLQSSDFHDIEIVTIKDFGKKTWADKDEKEQKDIIEKIAQLYQDFFASNQRNYYKLPKVADDLAKLLRDKYDFLSEKELKKIYHPSMIEFYAPAKDQKLDDGRWMKLLGSPVIGAFKNPMAMRVLHILKKQINALLKASLINGEDTRIVVETARELNDANMRWALETYQRERNAENEEYEIAITELLKDSDFNGSADPNNKDDIDKLRLWAELINSDVVSKLDSKGKPMCNTEEQWKTFGKTTTKLLFDIAKCKGNAIKKYRLWKEQGCICIYTGKPISITRLFDNNAFDFEHTIPRSMSFDDSMANLTICDAHFNRTIKRNQIPTQLANYENEANGYSAIRPRLQPWIDKVERLKDNVDFWKAQSRRAQEKDRKDHCIRQWHLWKMELDYWKNKVERFTMTEITSGFRNNQLNDTRIISKYAYHYLKTVFNKVDVQKGKVTSSFRKMLGVQSIDEKKDRDKHSHHAIDATILTMIPIATQRDKMLELFYKIQEKERFNEDVSNLKKELFKERAKCNLTGNISEIVPFIEDNILVNHISKDQTLTPAHRRKRIRGRIIPKKDSDGNIIYETDKDGNIRKNRYDHRIPLAKEWITGDSIRGQLHQDSFYGAITQWKKNKEGRVIRNKNGMPIPDEDNLLYVIKRELKYKSSSIDSGFKSWEELENVIVDKALFLIMKNQFPNGTSFKDACNIGIYMYKKKNKEEFDYSEQYRVGRIRHIRCKTSIKNPLKIKEQTYLSNKTYKQQYYADMGDLYTLCKYESADKKEKEFHVYSLFEICENRRMGLEEIPTYVESKKKHKLSLSHRLIKGNMLLVYKDSDEFLNEMDNPMLYQRLYIIRGFEKDGRIILQKHINAQADKELGKGESIKDFNNMPEKIRCSINTLNYLIQKKDFEITSKGIIFK